MNLWRRLELEWKVLLLAAVLFVAFVWPVQRYFISRLTTTLDQAIDPNLETTLRTELADAEGTRREAIKEHIERYRQTRVLVPIVVQEQQQLLLALSVGLFILFLLLAYWVLSRLTRPLKQLAGAVDKIAKGDVAQVDQVSGGALGVVEQAVINLQSELVALREKARIQGMESAWKDIARVMAHEIKNPLTPIRLTLDRIEERAATGRTIEPDELSKFLTRINTQIDMLERLVDQFRSFSREPEVRIAEVDCVSLLHQVAEGMGGKLASAVSGEAVIDSDPYLLQQIFLNLWKNALEVGATAVTAVIARKDATGAVITISDNGPGIAPADIDRIWLPYVTLKKNGTGLGLPVVKRLIETLGGSVSLASPAGDGVRIVIILPSLPRGEFV
jgi:nitrogen fixation/metabolism regulation signal transduction histidine kinase